MKLSIKHLVLLALMLLAAGLAIVLRPTISLADELPTMDLKSMIPASFGDWREQPQNSAQIINPQTQQLLDQIYSQTLSRTYVNSKGYQIMLSIAYGKNQSDALQLHKPEVCYPAQGFMVLNKQAGALALGGNIVPTTRLMTTLNRRQEPLTYWTVVGDHATRSGIDKKLTEMRYAMRNRIPDGMLVRVSSIDGDTDNAFANQNQFASQMVEAITPLHRMRFSGLTNSTPTSSPSS